MSSLFKYDKTLFIFMRVKYSENHHNLLICHIIQRENVQTKDI